MCLDQSCKLHKKLKTNHKGTAYEYGCAHIFFSILDDKPKNATLQKYKTFSHFFKLPKKKVDKPQGFVV